MTQENLGFYEEPPNGNGIVRARTTGQIRSWDMPRSQKALERFNSDIVRSEFPGIYILFAKSKVYVGEAKSLYDRIKTHMATPDDKIKDWEMVLIINDGRPATQSVLNDTVVRRELEIYLVRLLKANKFTVVSQGETQAQTSSQMHAVDSLIVELNFFLKKKNIITKVLDERGQEQVFSDELKKLLEKTGKKITEWGAYEAVVNDVQTFIRPGSKKPKGWQITFRDVFKDALSAGSGYLLVPRDGVLLIPLAEIQKVITDKNAYGQNTIDIWIAFGDKVTMRYKDEALDITKFRLVDKN